VLAPSSAGPLEKVERSFGRHFTNSQWRRDGTNARELADTIAFFAFHLYQCGTDDNMDIRCFMAIRAIAWCVIGIHSQQPISGDDTSVAVADTIAMPFTFTRYDVQPRVTW